MHLSIVIPVFNSSNILNNLIKQIKFNLKFKEIKKFEIILVNDCSQDNSWNKIKELSKKNLEIKKKTHCEDQTSRQSRLCCHNLPRSPQQLAALA